MLHKICGPSVNQNLQALYFLMLHKVLKLWNFWLYEVEKSKNKIKYHTMLASIIDNTSERSGRWQMYATIYRNELWSRSPTVKHHPHKCSLQRVQISLQLPVHRATNRAAAVAWRCRGCYRKNRSPLYIAWDQVRSLCNGILALEVSYQVSYL